MRKVCTCGNIVIMPDFCWKGAIIRNSGIKRREQYSRVSNSPKFFSSQMFPFIFFLVLTWDLFCFGPPCFLWPPVTNCMLFYSTLRCKKIARALRGHNKFTLTKLGAGAKQTVDCIALVSLNRYRRDWLPYQKKDFGNLFLSMQSWQKRSKCIFNC